MKKNTKKNWLVPVICLVITLLIVIVEIIIRFTHPEICLEDEIPSYLLPDNNRLLRAIHNNYEFYGMGISLLLVFIGIGSLVYRVICRIKEKRSKKEKVKYWLMPIVGIMGIIVGIIWLVICTFADIIESDIIGMIEKEEPTTYRKNQEGERIVYGETNCTLNEKLEPINNLSRQVEIVFISFTIISIPYSVYYTIKQNKDNKIKKIKG